MSYQSIIDQDTIDSAKHFMEQFKTNNTRMITSVIGRRCSKCKYTDMNRFIGSSPNGVIYWRDKTEGCHPSCSRYDEIDHMVLPSDECLQQVKEIMKEHTDYLENMFRRNSFKKMNINEVWDFMNKQRFYQTDQHGMTSVFDYITIDMALESYNQNYNQNAKKPSKYEKLLSIGRPEEALKYHPNYNPVEIKKTPENSFPGQFWMPLTTPLNPGSAQPALTRTIPRENVVQWSQGNRIIMRPQDREILPGERMSTVKIIVNK